MQRGRSRRLLSSRAMRLRLDRLREAGRPLARRYLVPFGGSCLVLAGALARSWLVASLVWLGLTSLSAWLGVLDKGKG